jgi:hypothetical protein
MVQDRHVGGSHSGGGGSSSPQPNRIYGEKQSNIVSAVKNGVFAEGAGDRMDRRRMERVKW